MSEEIKELLIKDFNEILVKEFCTDWEAKRLYIELLINSTPFSNLLDYIQQKENIIKEVREYIESKNNGICIQNGVEKGAYTFVLDFDKAREFIWHILEILDKGEDKE